MRCDTQKRVRATPVVLLSAAIAVAACGDTADPDEETGLTNVEPRESLRGIEEPGIDDATMAEPEGSPAIGASPASDTLTMPAETVMATAVLQPASGSDVTGEMTFRQSEGVVSISGDLRGLDPGEHGLHIHETGDCSAADASSAGGHFAPGGDRHGAPDAHPDRHHVGDLGNFTAAADGTAEIDASDVEMTLDAGPKSIINRAVVVHSGADDLATQPAGDAGARIACGVVTPSVDPAY